MLAPIIHSEAGSHARRTKHQRGQSMVEYALLLMLIGGVALSVLNKIGGSTSSSLNQVGAGLAGSGTTPVKVNSWSYDDTTFAGPMPVPNVTTATANTLLVAYIASDQGSVDQARTMWTTQKVSSVSGDGLTWHEAIAANLGSDSDYGSVAIWWALAPSPTGPFTVTVTRSEPATDYCVWATPAGPPTQGFCNGMVYVEAYTGADPSNPVLANGHNGNLSSSTSYNVPITTTVKGSLVRGVGNNWGFWNPLPTPTNGQTVLHQVTTPLTNSDVYWVQQIDAPTGIPGPESLSDVGTTTEDWQYAAVEIQGS